MNLYSEYQKANAAYEEGTGTKNALTSATDALLTALGYEGDKLDELKGKYEGLDEEIRGLTLDKLNQASGDALEGYKAAYENLEDYFGNGDDWVESVKKVFGYGAGAESIALKSESSKELGDKVRQILKDNGFEINFNDALPEGFVSINTDSLDEILESYDKLVNARTALQEGLGKDYVDSTNAGVIGDKIKAFEDVLGEYIDSKELLNERVADELVYGSLLNGIPETTDDLKFLRDELISTAQAGERFQGSEEEIASAIDTAFKNAENIFPGFESLMERTSDISKTAAEKLADVQNFFRNEGSKKSQAEIDEFDAWLSSLDERNLDLVYSISLNTSSAQYDLEGWKSALDDAQFHFDDLMQEDKEGSFSESVETYISKMNQLGEALESIQSGELGEKDLAELKYELTKAFPSIAYESDNLSDAIKHQMDTLTGYSSEVDDTGETIKDATGIMALFEDAFGRVDSEEDIAALEAFQEAVLTLARVVGDTTFSIDIKAETEGMEKLWTAMKESVSSTGLTTDSIEAMMARYRELGEGFDPAKLFEKTANGIHLNTTALRGLEHEYEAQKKQKVDATLAALVVEYDKLTAEINRASDSASVADLYAQRANIRAQIDDTSILAAQYAGLTSAFYKWEQAQSIGEEGDMYDSLTGGLENIKELYEEGLIGTNKFRTAVQLMSNEDLSNASPEELIRAYEEGYPKMERYFTEGRDGALNFLNDLHDLNSEWVSLNEDGSWDINFGLGNDQEIADALGISVESVQSIMRKLSDFAFDINLDSVYSAFALLSSKAEEANDKLKELGKTDFTFNFESSDLDYITNEQLPEAERLLDQFRNSDGEVDLSIDGAEDAQSILVSLMSRKQAICAPDIMRLDATAVAEADEQIGAAVEALQSFIEMSDYLERQTKIGVDTTETQEKLRGIVTDLQNLPDEVKTKIGLDSEELNTALQNIANTEIDAKAGVELSPDDIAVVQEAIDGISVKDIEILTNSSAVTKELKSVDKFRIKDKDFRVTISNDPLSALARINSYQFDDKSYKVTATTVNTSTGNGKGTSSSASLAVAEGTAKAGGDWGVKETGDSLGGELKPEIVVRDGHWFTIGEDSAEFFHHKKGDIIFNGDQSEQILKYGKIRSGNKRGKAFAGGTAFSRGTGSITASGSVVTKPTGGGDGSSKGSGNSKDKAKDDSTVIDWIEIAIDRIERVINRLATVATSAFHKLSDRLGATNEELSKVAEEISIQQSGYDRYMKQANSVGLSSDLAKKVRDGTIDISKYSGDTADKIKEYQQWYEKALDCDDAISQLKETMAELYQNKFNDTATDYENQLSLLEHLTNTYNNGISDLEERGYLASTGYYEALGSVEQQNIDTRKKELADLEHLMSEGINSGAIAEGSEAWYEFQQQINGVKESIQESETAMVSYANSIRQIKWDRFDYLQEQISNITEEADFLIDLMENSDLYTDNGQFTDTGTATMGLHAQNYNVYMAQADKYAQELMELNKEIANDPNNTKLLERREELLEAQRDSILAAEDEKQAIVDMVREGIELELSALKDLIDKYGESLDSAKDLYDYQKKLKDQTSEIASLQKQLSAYAGDTSEENRARIQKLQVDLSSAMEDLEETQYEHYIDEQKKLLDNLYDEYEAALNARLDNIDALISDMIDTANANASNICDTILSEADKVGYTVTENEKAIWSNEGGASTILTKYGESFLSQLTSVNDVISKIGIKLGAMTTESEQIADTTISSATPSTPTDKTVTPPAKVPSDKDKKKDPSKSTSKKKTKFNDEVKKGVAAAIWIYGGAKSGWGNDPERKKKLTAKFGSANAAAVQKYINAHGSNGDLYNYWLKKGKSNLSKYYYSAFKKGGLADYTGMAWLDGTPTEPEMVLNPEDTKNFIALKDAMRSIADGSSPLSDIFGSGDISSGVLSQLAKIDTPSLNSGTAVGDITCQVTIPIDHVQDYNDFVNQLRKDGKFEKMIQSMTIDRIAGKSKIAKNKYQW